ncbi:MAG: GDSL-type esterase/lipase family protein [Solibacillus sp.]
MWKIVALLITLLLGGCQMVTIDDLPEEQVTEQNADKLNVEQAVEEQQEMTKKEEFIDLLGTVFNLKWSERKNDDARPLTYLALGDSLTRGIGDEQNLSGYAGRLANAMELWPAVTEVEMDNRGKNGRHSEKVLELLARGHYDEELAQADLITMTIGGNDVMKVVKADLFALKKEMFDTARSPFAARYNQIIQEIRKRNEAAPIILVGFYNPFSIITDEFTPFESIINEWNEEMRLVAEADANACFVPVDDFFMSNEDLVYHTDFFHPNARGYERMTERIIETMVQCDIETMSGGWIGFEEETNE